MADRGYAGQVGTGRDDDALSWEGDDDRTLYTGGERTADPAPEPALPASAPRAEPDPVVRAAEASADEDEDDVAPGMSNVALIALGVLGGVYGLLAIGWLIGGVRLQDYALFLVAPIGYQVSLWLAVLAPVAWFATVLYLTRSGRAWVRFTLLVVGAVLLLPWPFIMIGAVGS